MGIFGDEAVVVGSVVDVVVVFRGARSRCVGSRGVLILEEGCLRGGVGDVSNCEEGGSFGDDSERFDGAAGD